jgi:sirohydrochlorin ferrochelatase
MRTGIIIVDHGSTQGESNRMLEELALLFAKRFSDRYDIVEPAHMELAEPDIVTAFAKCVERGAERVVVCPFFLGPGKHWTKDIPQLTAAAGSKFPQTRYHVTATLGIDDLILELLNKRIESCVQQDYSCDNCRGTLREGAAPAEPSSVARDSSGSAGASPSHGLPRP